MERIGIKQLQPGQVFTQTLFSPSGQKLLNAGIPLTQGHIDLMRRSSEWEVISANDVNELMAAGVVTKVDSSSLRVGQTADESLISSGGQMLVEPGQAIEEHHLDALEAGGGGAFIPSNKSKQQQRRERILLGDALVEELEKEIPNLKLRVKAENASAWIEPAGPSSWPDPETLSQQRSIWVERLRDTFARIEAGLAVDLNDLVPLIEDLLDRLAHHPTRFTQLALLCPRREDYLPDHAYTATVLAMAIAAQLKWPREAVHEVGLAGLVFDLGMLLVPERIRSGGCQLTDIDRSRVQRHPVFTLAMLQVVQNVPTIIKLASMQHHERENGSGYPRGARRDATCDYARVLAVADSFAASTEPRHYRRPKLPYIAMEETIRSTSAMAFWKPAVRALLQAAGLFPVGSFVKLSNAKSAHVIASNPKQLDRPTVQPLTADGQADGPCIDLAAVPTRSLVVIRPIASGIG